MTSCECVGWVGDVNESFDMPYLTLCYDILPFLRPRLTFNNDLSVSVLVTQSTVDIPMVKGNEGGRSR